MKKLVSFIAALAAMVCGCVTALADQKPVTREEAIRIALSDAGLKEDQVTFTKVRMDSDDGRQAWEIDFVKGRIEYEYEVDLRTGRILESDRDFDNRPDLDDDRDDDWDDWFDFD